MVTILYFAWLRERIGTGEERVSPPAEVTTVVGLIDWLAARSDGHADALGDRARIRVAADQHYVGMDASIAGVREVALFPPVTGG